MRPHPGGIYVADICKTALADQDGHVAVFRLYVDESGIDDGAPVIVVAGYIARPTVWQKFTAEWKPHILRARPKISAWHAADAQHLRDEFKGWTTEEVAATAKVLLPIIPKYAIGAAMGIDLRAVDEALKGRDDLRRYFKDAYGMCFQWLVMTFIDGMHMAGNRRPVAIVHERNSYRQSAIEVFDHLKEIGDPFGQLTSLTFGDKEAFVPLQAADILAYETFRRLKNPNGPERRALTAISPKGRVPRIRLFDQKNIKDLIEMLEKMQAYHKAGRLLDGYRYE